MTMITRRTISSLSLPSSPSSSLPLVPPFAALVEALSLPPSSPPPPPPEWQRAESDIVLFLMRAMTSTEGRSQARRPGRANARHSHQACSQHFSTPASQVKHSSPVGENGEEGRRVQNDQPTGFREANRHNRRSGGHWPAKIRHAHVSNTKILPLSALPFRFRTSDMISELL